MSGPAQSTPEVLALHAVRILGWGESVRLAARFGLDPVAVDEWLFDFESFGWVRRVAMAPDVAWTLTDRGRAANSGQLGAELDATGSRSAVESAHRDFASMNAVFLVAATDWQVRPTRWDPHARNDHDDWAWDENVLDRLRTLERQLAGVGAALSEQLCRFDGYPERFTAALDRVRRGERRWLAEPGIDSAHAIWMELHEDVLATLGLQRNDPPTGGAPRW